LNVAVIRWRWRIVHGFAAVITEAKPEDAKSRVAEEVVSAPLLHYTRQLTLSDTLQNAPLLTGAHGYVLRNTRGVTH